MVRWLDVLIHLTNKTNLFAVWIDDNRYKPLLINYTKEWSN